eukprot:snap_masked-scaffold_24-processed-gene-5.16-mRNA-1 protein AED:1.00 eAED:1.00 QI:0/-1/0/0/-1/1/1/0/80
MKSKRIKLMLNLPGYLWVKFLDAYKARIRGFTDAISDISTVDLVLQKKSERQPRDVEVRRAMILRKKTGGKEEVSGPQKN